MPPPPPPAKAFEIAIIGGGITGITLAIALLRRDIAVQIYEQGHAFSEIGAGVAFGPNAVRAMGVCDRSVRDTFEGVATHNQWPSKRRIFFDFVDGMRASRKGEGEGAGDNDTLFTLNNEQGANAVHRADFMNAMAKLIPEHVAHFRMHLDDVVEDPKTGRLRMRFHDGTTAEADAVIGCDGIKSRTRALVVGEDHPSTKPTYSHKYAYRAVMPMRRAIEVAGEERAQNACLWMGHKAHLLTFPINRGETFNMVAIVTDEDEWPSSDRLTLPAHKDDVRRDFGHFGEAVRSKLELVDDDVDKWALFDLADHPVPTFYRGRICIVGDASHATTPHHGAGAGFCIEDTAVLGSLLADRRVTRPEHLEAVFAAFDASRRGRDQWLVRDSRRTGELYELNTEVGDDFGGIEGTLRESFAAVWDYDVNQGVREAKRDLGARLAEGV